MADVGIPCREQTNSYDLESVQVTKTLTKQQPVCNCLEHLGVIVNSQQYNQCPHTDEFHHFTRYEKVCATELQGGQSVKATDKTCEQSHSEMKYGQYGCTVCSALTEQLIKDLETEIIIGSELQEPQPLRLGQMEEEIKKASQKSCQRCKSRINIIMQEVQQEMFRKLLDRLTAALKSEYLKQDMDNESMQYECKCYISEKNDVLMHTIPHCETQSDHSTLEEPGIAKMQNEKHAATDVNPKCIHDVAKGRQSLSNNLQITTFQSARKFKDIPVYAVKSYRTTSPSLAQHKDLVEKFNVADSGISESEHEGGGREDYIPPSHRSKSETSACRYTSLPVVHNEALIEPQETKSEPQPVHILACHTKTNSPRKSSYQEYRESTCIAEASPTFTRIKLKTSKRAQGANHDEDSDIEKSDDSTSDSESDTEPTSYDFPQNKEQLKRASWIRGKYSSPYYSELKLKSYKFLDEENQPKHDTDPKYDYEMAICRGQPTEIQVPRAKPEIPPKPKPKQMRPPDNTLHPFTSRVETKKSLKDVTLVPPSPQDRKSASEKEQVSSIHTRSKLPITEDQFDAAKYQRADGKNYGIGKETEKTPLHQRANLDILPKPDFSSPAISLRQYNTTESSCDAPILIGTDIQNVSGDGPANNKYQSALEYTSARSHHAKTLSVQPNEDFARLATVPAAPSCTLQPTLYRSAPPPGLTMQNHTDCQRDSKNLSVPNIRDIINEFTRYTDQCKIGELYTKGNFIGSVFDERGGYLQTPAGDVVLYIPPGAVEKGKQQPIFMYADGYRYEKLQTGEVVLTPEVKCGPRGTGFLTEVMLTLPHGAVQEDSWKFTTASKQRGGKWKSLPTTSMLLNGKSVFIFLRHFCTYRAAGQPKLHKPMHAQEPIKVGVRGRFVDDKCCAIHVGVWQDESRCQEIEWQEWTLIKVGSDNAQLLITLKDSPGWRLCESLRTKVINIGTIGPHLLKTLFVFEHVKSQSAKDKHCDASNIIYLHNSVYLCLTSEDQYEEHHIPFLIERTDNEDSSWASVPGRSEIEEYRHWNPDWKPQPGNQISVDGWRSLCEILDHYRFGRSDWQALAGELGLSPCQ
ncbi:uncharacterized protein [Ptychodera flava]|uniref:uncharacterized protein n=1 Tax=Ptychodera flava TaxID=63121 RepID=UPI00396A4ECB